MRETETVRHTEQNTLGQQTALWEEGPLGRAQGGLGTPFLLHVLWTIRTSQWQGRRERGGKGPSRMNTTAPGRSPGTVRPRALHALLLEMLQKQRSAPRAPGATQNRRRST